MSNQKAKQNEKHKDVLGNLSLALGIIACLSYWLYIHRFFSIRTAGLGAITGLIGVGISLAAKRKLAQRSVAGLMICSCAIAGNILFPSTYNLRTVRTATSLSNLRFIGQSISFFEQEYQNRPDSLDELQKVGIKQKGLQSPISGLRYEYINLPKNAPGDIIWAYDPSPNIRHVYSLLHDGSVKVFWQPDFDETLNKTKKFMADYSKEH